jgi:hypothetical protein
MKKTVVLILILINTTLTARANTDTTTYAGIKLAFEAGPSAIAGELLIRIHDNTELGFRYQRTATTPVVFFSDPSVSYENSLKVGAKSYSYTKYYASECLSGDHYFNANDKTPVKLFAGGGIGLYNEYYTLNTYTVTSPPNGANFFGTSSAETNITVTSHIGGFFRVGMDVWHFRFAIDYDITGLGYPYGSANIGFFLGGGKK